MLDLIYYKDKVQQFNPDGQVGILTLWSRVDTTLKKIGEIPRCVAAISNFYGDGLSQLIINLLANPQIKQLHVFGANRTKSLEELKAYFVDGTEEIDINRSKQFRVVGTNRLVNKVIADNSIFGAEAPSVIYHESLESLLRALDSYVPSEVSRKAIKLELEEQKVDAFPSSLVGHQIIGTDLIDAWTELLFHLVRFGNVVELAKGKRRELCNVKVVVSDVKWLPDSAYSKVNLDPQNLRAYANFLASPDLPDDASYTYGNRLKRYFGFDAVETVISKLCADQEDRKAYISIWDQRLDPLDDAGSQPCWVSAFFRIVRGSLVLSCTFRTHRAYTAWVENAHGLAELMRFVASEISERTGKPVVPGELCVYSQSISIEPSQIQFVQSVIGTRKWKMRDDGRGDVVFSIEDGKIIAEHKFKGLLIGRYAGTNVESISHQLSQDHVVSDLGHALYVGRQLGKLQMCLKHGLPYEES